MQKWSKLFFSFVVRCNYQGNSCKLIIFSQLQQDIQMKQNEIQRETRKKDKMERELNNEKKEVDAKMGEIKSLQSQLQRCKDDNIRMEQQLKEQRVS